MRDITHIEDRDGDSEISKFESSFSIEEYEEKLEKKRLKNRKKKANLELFLEDSNEK